MLLFVEVSLLTNLFEKHCIFFISPHLHIWRTRIKLLTLQGIKVSWYFYREAYTRLLLQSQTVLGHFSEGHFAVTSQTIFSFGEKKTVCVFVKRKRGLNEDLYDSEQFTYNVLCQLLPYNDITALMVAHD